ncbi:MAG: hypothetical protein IVW57_10795 [Ktedonobacterales bacterium]|nr:hypothetical protein [Ktedonobacterales bacterium]
MAARERWRRGGLALLLALPLLAACGTTGTRAGERAVASPTPTHTATPRPTRTPTATLLPCDPALATAPDSVHVGDLVIGVRSQGYPARLLPDGLPLAPFRLAAPTGPALDAQLPPMPAVNPELGEPVAGYSATICDAAARTHIVTGLSLRITDFIAATGPLNEWAICDGWYARPRGAQGGGCGGGVGPTQNCQHASFLADAGVGAAVATAASHADGCQGDLPLPVTLLPGQALPVRLGITPPTTPGTYHFALGIALDGGPAAFAPIEPMVLLAPVAHRWTGAACQTSAMQAQIPPATDPPTAYLCPEA